MPADPPAAGVGAVTTVALGLALAASTAYAQTPVVWPTAPVDGVCGYMNSREAYNSDFGMPVHLPLSPVHRQDRVSLQPLLHLCSSVQHRVDSDAVALSSPSS